MGQSAPVTVPRATYRLQLHREFGFADAAAIVDYLSALGVSHAYCSPYLQAAAGSTHGYDLVDPGRVNAELGGSAGHAHWLRTLAAHQMGQVLDIVPNHMAVTAGNVWWEDVLEHGPSSSYASFFDVEWDPPEARLRNVILLPVLRDHYGRVLEAGEIRLERDGATFHVVCEEHRYRVDPSSLGRLLASAADEAGSAELAFLADALRALPRATATDWRSVERRQRDSHVIAARLHTLITVEPDVAAAVDAVVAATNRSPDALHDFLEAQNYRLASWRAAARDLGYRRFFDVSTLIGVRVEDDRVFAETHRLILEWLRAGAIDGVRIDHLDGLRDPEEYLERLHAAAPRSWLIVEKILQPGESLPEGWPVSGTTGYDFMARVLGLFVDPHAEDRFTDLYQTFTGETSDYRTIVRERKLLVQRTILGSDVNRLADLFLSICEKHRRYRDYSRHDVTEALRELIAVFPVYRTYERPYAGSLSACDRAYVHQAVRDAHAERPDLDVELFEFIASVLLLEHRGGLEHEFVARFQQATSPVMAKGVEDTAFYNYARFIALNEVGSDPGRFGVSVDAFHQANLTAHAQWPDTMVATATHDTKRGEDVRARLAVLSEVPDAWAGAVARWSELTARFRIGDYPDRNTEYFFYQTVVGAWPLSVERASAYMEKATREARTFTSWTAPDETYDRAVRSFVEAALRDAAFVRDVERFVEGVLTPGRVNALSQTLLKMMSPGVPDLYQGTELWTLDLVDPDNRRPVDYELRRQLLRTLERLTPGEIWRRRDEGLPKLWVISQALAARARQRDAVSAAGTYAVVQPQGSSADHVVSFMRGDRLIVVVPRLTMDLDRGWGDTCLSLPPGRWRNLFADGFSTGDVPVADLMAEFPVALLERCG